LMLPPPSAAIDEPDPRTREEALRIRDVPARELRGMPRTVIRTMAQLLELAYMAFDQKKFERSITLCEQILLIDPHYRVARELKEDCEKSRHSDEYQSLVAWKVEEWKKLTDDDEEPVIPWVHSVFIPSAEEWAEISKRLSDPFRRGEGSSADAEDDPDKLAIERKLDTMRIDLAFENTKLEDILSFVRDFSGLNLLLDAEVRDRVDPELVMSFKVQGMVLKHVLQVLTSFLNLDYVVTDERVVLLTAPSRIPALSPHR
jgi:hypothetical protein